MSGSFIFCFFFSISETPGKIKSLLSNVGGGHCSNNSLLSSSPSAGNSTQLHSGSFQIKANTPREVFVAASFEQPRASHAGAHSVRGCEGQALAAAQPCCASPWLQEQVPERIPGVWGLASGGTRDAGSGLISRRGSSEGRRMALGKDLAFLWCGNSEGCNLPLFGAVSLESCSPFQCWGPAQGHQQTVGMDSVRWASWHAGTGPCTRTGPTSTPRSPLSPTGLGHATRHSTELYSTIFAQTFKSKTLRQSSPTHAYTRWCFQAVFKGQSSGKGTALPFPSVPPNGSRPWSEMRGIDWTSKEWAHLANIKVV